MSKDYIAPELRRSFSENQLFEQISALEGEVFRQVAARKTIRTKIGEHFYFAKVHYGVGWIEIIKNLIQLRLPVLGATNEYQAIRLLNQIGVSTMTPVLFCDTGRNPAKRHSAIVTESLENMVSLEDFQTENPALKRTLIKKLAEISRSLHSAGLNHRDYYLCHFLMAEDADMDPDLHVIDLHRAQIRAVVPERWLVKDVGGLLFSAFDKHLTRRDLLRFIRVYSGRDLRSELNERAGFWHKVVLRARKLYLQDHAEMPTHIQALLGQGVS